MPNWCDSLWYFSSAFMPVPLPPQPSGNIILPPAPQDPPTSIDISNALAYLERVRISYSKSSSHLHPILQYTETHPATPHPLGAATQADFTNAHTYYISVTTAGACKMFLPLLCQCHLPGPKLWFHHGLHLQWKPFYSGIFNQRWKLLYSCCMCSWLTRIGCYAK